MKKSPVVRLKLRVRLPDGTRAYLDPVYTANHKLKALHAYHNGCPVHFPDGVYHLRYLQGGRRAWEAVGRDADAATTAHTRRERELAAVAAGVRVVGSETKTSPTEPSPTASTKRLLSACIVEYLAETKDHKLAKTYAAYSKSMLSFAETMFAVAEHPGLSLALAAELRIEDLTRTHAMAWIAELRKKGNQPRTVRNRATHLNTFMRHFGLSSLLIGKDKPTFTKKKVLAYNEHVLVRMFEHATVDEADLLYFFLSTGAREGDASGVCWSDVDLVQKLYKVTEHIDLGYRPKDKEEEPLPIPDLLVERLHARRKRYPRTRLIFGTSKGQRDGHMLRTIKELALRAGANCCECVNKNGQSCIEHPVCKHIILHKLRKTFATTLHHNGLPARTIQRYLRHSDIATTLAYLADQPDEQVRETINATFVVGGIRRISSRAA